MPSRQSNTRVRGGVICPAFTRRLHVAYGRFAPILGPFGGQRGLPKNGRPLLGSPKERHLGPSGRFDPGPLYLDCAAEVWQRWRCEGAGGHRPPRAATGARRPSGNNRG